ncbi:MAG: YgiQ family radical SAM protein [Spirochaetes bacterium RBG_13_51_14]|nr:MAG: YgiQ family radical SAM protein [Spirochaetes bacterium RBG_13_51_14]
MFIPTTAEEVISYGWDRLDIILVSGDTYIDSPYMGTAIIGHVLMDAGYRVGIIAQPDVRSSVDITRLGEPLLFWGVSSGSVDSMISNYTASGKKRLNDDLTPGGRNIRRPDRAVIVYTNLIRRFFKNSAPIVIGGIEASLRRIAHYDFWDDRVRRSILFDAKADILVYGMGERTVRELADCLKMGNNYRHIRGLCYISGEAIDGYIELPSFESVAEDKRKFQRMFDIFFHNSDSMSGKGMTQKHGGRILIHNPPSNPLYTKELDHVYELPYERDTHPYYKKRGLVRALETIRFSITTHRGCFGGCNFCSIAAHQGSGVVSRSEASVIKEAENLSRHPGFRGIISDIGGPTANMYGMRCKKLAQIGQCADRQCLTPDVCNRMRVSHKSQVRLLRRIRRIPGMGKVFIASGIRHDLVMADDETGREYLAEIARYHVSGQLKVAPEHSESRVLELMGKPSVESLLSFNKLFNSLSRTYRKKQFLTYYLIASHPGCTLHDMRALRAFAQRELHVIPEQVQIYTPVPSTWSAVMYYTGTDPFTGDTIFIERDMRKKEHQKAIICRMSSKERKRKL